MRITSCGKIVLIAVALAGLAFASAANASVMSGSMAVVVDPFVSSTASYTASSVNLNAQNLITTAEQGTFLSEVPAHSDLTADSATITGLSTTPLSDSIGDFSSSLLQTRHWGLWGHRLTTDLTSICKRLRRHHTVDRRLERCSLERGPLSIPKASTRAHQRSSRSAFRMVPALTHSRWRRCQSPRRSV